MAREFRLRRALWGRRRKTLRGLASAPRGGFEGAPGGQRSGARDRRVKGRCEMASELGKS